MAIVPMDKASQFLPRGSIRIRLAQHSAFSLIFVILRMTFSLPYHTAPLCKYLDFNSAEDP